ncbi:photosynthetic complex assembly protein PuhC [Sphingomonas rosea]|uniref:Photosynthetic complex assembly protein PuhC n=1 Tax=Sphingomonas rosea TaxID=335605 RepID=A0ABP7U5E4_9SPHN
MNELEHHSHENMIPPGALKAACALIICVLVLVSAVRFGLVDVGPSPAEARLAAHEQPVAQRLLRFDDGAGGKVLVSDAGNGRQVAAIGTEGSGFIRGVMRGLARERHLNRQGPAAPFALASWPDGALTLTDTATGRVIELGSFGPTNRASFAAFLAPETRS